MSLEKWLKQVVFLSVAAMVFVSTADAAEEGMPQEMTVQGVVNVMYDANDMIMSVTLTTDEVSYDVVLNKKGLELAREADGEEVEVMGMVAEVEGRKHLTVRSYKIIEKE